MGGPPEKRVHDVLVDATKTLATAESATGGLLGDRITSIAGSSAYYLGGVIAYANDVKEHVLKVSKAMMIEHGAVSSETALAMARGVRQLLNADYGLSITGIAGPGGGSAEKPVGLTWVAVSSAQDERARKFVYAGTRDQNKQRAVDSVLELLLEVMDESGNGAAIIQVETKDGQEGGVIPIAFSWHDEHHIILDWGRRWREGEHEHMLVRIQGGDTYELSVDSTGTVWRLERKLRTPPRAT